MQAKWPLVAWFVSLWAVSDSRSVFPSRRVESSLQWRHNGHNGVSNHRRLDCLLNCLFRRRSKKTSKLRVTGLCERNWSVNSPHKGPVTPKMFPFHDDYHHAALLCYCVCCRDQPIYFMKGFTILETWLPWATKKFLGTTVFFRCWWPDV